MFRSLNQFFSNMVFQTPQWNFHTFDLDRDLRAAEDRVGASLDATDRDLQ